MDEAIILTTVAIQLEAIGMMNVNATILIRHPCIIRHSSQFVRLTDRSICRLLEVKSIFDPTEGHDKNVLRMS